MSHAGSLQESGMSNPFDTMAGEKVSAWVVDATAKAKYDNMFFNLSPTGQPPKVSGGYVRRHLTVAVKHLHLMGSARICLQISLLWPLKFK